VFNEERRQPLSFGIALYADPEQSDATIDGLFIAPGRELESTHFLIGQERGAAAAPWAEVKKRLEHETPGFRSFRDQHNAFVKALLQNTRGRGAVAESEQWLRALRLGAQFRGVEDPNQFVRDHVLPDDPLDLPALREDARRYSDLLRTIRDLEEKEQLQAVQTDFAAYFKKESEARRGYALAAMARREGVRRQVETGEAAIAGYRQEENSLAARVEQTRERVETARRRGEDARRALDADPTSGHLEMAKARRLHAQVALQQANDGLSAIRKTFADAARRLADAEQAGIGGSSLLRTRFAAAADLDAPADLWPRGIEAVEAASALAPAVETLATEMDTALGTVSSHQAEARTKLTDATDRLEAARAGGPILGKEATRLIQALRAEGMDPTPLCAAAEVTDSAWANAAETLLGAGREAILVEGDQVRAAVRRIRRQRSEFWGCIIVQVMGTERFAGSPLPGSLAEMIRTSDPRARAFVNQRLGGIRRVETEAELEGAERAVTADCQYAAGGGVQNRRPVERLILGRRYDAADVDRLTAERDQAASAYQAAAGRLRAISTAQARLRDAAEALRAIPDIEAGLKSRRAANDELDLAAIAIADLEQALPVELERAVADAKRDLAEYESDLESAREARDNNKLALAKAETTLETHKRDFNAADAAVAALPAAPPERSEAVRILEERLAGRHTTTSIAEQATREADVAAADAKTCLNAARRALLNYWQRYNEASLAAASASTTPGEVEGAERWVSERLERLRSHELRQYKEAVVEIEAKVRRGLRENLFLALSSRIDHAKEMIQDLNRHLRSRRFHRERYVFTLQPRPEFAEIFQAISAARRDPGLFDDGFIVDGDEAVRRGVDRVVRMLEAEGEAADSDIETLADYRNYTPLTS
jgi:chromosome segregation ATPase